MELAPTAMALPLPAGHVGRRHLVERLTARFVGVVASLLAAGQPTPTPTPTPTTSGSPTPTPTPTPTTSGSPSPPPSLPVALRLVAERPGRVGHHEWVRALVRDGHGAPIASAVVRLRVSGADHAVRTATTDSHGLAGLRYLPERHGRDSIAAYADLNGDRRHESNEPQATIRVLIQRATQRPRLRVTHQRSLAPTVITLAVTTRPRASHAWVKFFVIHHGHRRLLTSRRTGNDGIARTRIRLAHRQTLWLQARVEGRPDVRSASTKRVRVRVR